MSTSDTQTLAHPYLTDLRHIISRAFGPPGPVPARAVPGGPLPERLEAWREWSSEGMLSASGEGRGEYWVRSIPHRMIVTEPLMDLAEDSSLAHGDVRRLEREILREYYRTYDALPLSPEILDLMARQENPDIVEWLEVARQRIMRSRTVGDACRHRATCRADALRHAATGSWSEASTRAAELVTDVILLLRGVRDDVYRAVSRAIATKNSVGAVMEATHVDEWAWDRVISQLTRGVVTWDDYEPADADVVARYVADRPRPQALLTSGGGTEPETAETNRRPAAILQPPRSARPRTHAEPPSSSRGEVSASPPSDPRAEFGRILEGLEDRILGRPQLCRDLALIGLAAACGVERQRVLLCGPSGSGKSHTAQALADALGRPFLRVHAPDIVETGFRGLQLNDILQTLASSAGGTLDGTLIFFDEADKIRLIPDLDGNSRAAAAGRINNLLAFLDGSPVTLDRGDVAQLETRGALVVGAGAFEGRFVYRPPSTPELERWGWTTEFTSRWTTRLVLSPPSRSEAHTLLAASERSVAGQLGPLLEALGIEVRVPDATISYAVDRWTRTDGDLRSASAWLVEAARRRVIRALEDGDESEIVLTPDDLQIPIE